MKYLLLLAGCCLAGCGSKDSTPAPALTPAAPVLVGHWQADAVYARPAGGTPTTNPSHNTVQVYGPTQVDFTAGTLTTDNPPLIYSTSKTTASTSYTSGAGLLSYPAQKQQPYPAVDSLVVEGSGYKWTHYDGSTQLQSNYREVLHLHR